MKKILTKYYGAILLYSVIIVGIFVLNARFAYLNKEYVEKESIALMED